MTAVLCREKRVSTSIRLPDPEDLNAERMESIRLMDLLGKKWIKREALRLYPIDDVLLSTVINSASDLRFQVLSWNNSVDVAMLEKEFAGLKAFR